MRTEINLYLDDLRDIPEGFVGARTIDEAIKYLENPNYIVNILTLDHDLGEDSKGKLLPTGQDLVKYIGEHGLFAKNIYIHSKNPVGKEAMFSSLKSFQRHNLIDSTINIHSYSITPDKYTI